MTPAPPQRLAKSLVLICICRGLHAFHLSFSMPTLLSGTTCLQGIMYGTLSAAARPVFSNAPQNPSTRTQTSRSGYSYLPSESLQSTLSRKTHWHYFFMKHATHVWLRAPTSSRRPKLRRPARNSLSMSPECKSHPLDPASS